MHRNKKRKGEPPPPDNPQLISGHSGLLFVSIVLQKISSCILWNICCYFKYILSSSACNRLCLWEVLLWIQSAQLLQESWTCREEEAEPGSFSLRDKTLYNWNVKLILTLNFSKMSLPLILPCRLCVLFSSSGHA